MSFRRGSEARVIDFRDLAPIRGYDPEAAGAECWRCPLRGHTVVPPELRPGAPLVIGQEPGGTEERYGRPLVGPSGVESNRATSALGFERKDLSFTNARLCRLPQYESRKAEHKESLSACRPRLQREMATARSLLLYGSVAFEAVVTGARGESGLTKNRGFPFEVEITEAWRENGVAAELVGTKIPALATYNPAAVLRKRNLTETYRADVAKALRIVRGASTWVEPASITDPDADTLSSLLDRWARSGTLVAVDIETAPTSDEPDPLTDLLRCVGIGSAELAVCAGFRSVERPARRWRCPPEIARERIAAFLADPRARLCGHNVNVYDRPVLERFGMPLPDFRRVLDSVISHHCVDSEMPHNLGYVVTRYTDAPAWKPVSHDAWTSDIDLAHYCNRDVSLSARIAPTLAQEVIASDQAKVYQSDIRYQQVCVGMHAAGMHIDESERVRHRTRLEKKRVEAVAKAIQATRGREINLGSHDQVRKYLFDTIGLAPTAFETDSGKPSTGTDALYELMNRRLPASVALFVDALQEYRRAEKWISTFVGGTAPGSDGRIHPDWHPHIQKVGRPSCSRPGMQQFPDKKHDRDSMRSIIDAAPGNVLVYADMPQIHLRIIAEIANDEIWLDAFARDVDIHLVNAADFAGKHVSQVEPYERDFAKVAVYLLVYGGTAETFLTQLQRVRSPKTGNRPYAEWDLTMAKRVRDTFLRRHPWLEQWWDAAIRRYRQRGYGADYVLGRKHYFKDAYAGDDENMRSEIINYEVLPTEAALMGGSGAAGRLIDAVPFGLWGPGLIFHGFDSMLLEVREDRGDAAGAALVEAMDTTFGRVRIKPKFKKGPNWSVLE